MTEQFIQQSQDSSLLAVARNDIYCAGVVSYYYDEGGYTAFVPSLPGCISKGDTKEEALKNIQEAIELYLLPKTALRGDRLPAGG